MFHLHAPGERQLRAIADRQGQLPFSYAEVGGTREEAFPAGYVVDRNHANLGLGEHCWHRARAALRRWTMFELGWVRVHDRDAPLEEGTTAVVLARTLGVTVVNTARIVYVFDDIVEDVHRFGFAYGTLPQHAESGEERFRVCWNRTTDVVSYDLLAFSRPGHWLVRLGAPWARTLQRRFARDSLATMHRACHGGP